ncbi:MAG: MlaD family protein [Nitriliruptorales bacterium]|nr:MlaD family protein [Nitriliruptorales bacterium]
MLLERSQVVIGIVAAVVIGAGTVFAVFLSAGAFESGYPVRAEFENAMGLAPGDDVLVAGVRAGTVSGVRIDGGRIVADLTVRAELPVDSRARIINKNMLGARAVELVAGDAWDELLEDVDGDATIPLEATDVPVTLPELGDETVALLRDADAEAFTDLIVSLADVTEGQREEVGQLLDGLRDFSGIVADNREELVAFIEHSSTVIDALADRDEAIVTIIDEFGSTLNTLAARRDDLRRLLANVGEASALTADLLEEEDAELDRVLNELDVVLDLLDQHQVDMAHAVAYGGVGFDGFSTVGYQGGEAEEDNPYWGNILTSGLGQTGIDHAFGCGGAIDDFLDQIFGPTECPEEEAQAPTEAVTAAAGVGAFFVLGPGGGS